MNQLQTRLARLEQFGCAEAELLPFGWVVSLKDAQGEARTEFSFAPDYQAKMGESVEGVEPIRLTKTEIAHLLASFAGTARLIPTQIQ